MLKFLDVCHTLSYLEKPASILPAEVSLLDVVWVC